MKNTFKKFMLLGITLVSTGVIFATPTAQVTDTTLNCNENVMDKGYSGCELQVGFKVVDFNADAKKTEDNFTVTCDATFDYWEDNTDGSATHNFVSHKYESGSGKVTGLNTKGTLTIDTDFSIIHDSFSDGNNTYVYKVEIANLTCKLAK